jgi:hypothetical protein
MIAQPKGLAGGTICAKNSLGTQYKFEKLSNYCAWQGYLHS